jgi:hypothetical protein
VAANVQQGAIQSYYVDVPLPFSVLHFVSAPQYGNSAMYISLAAASGTMQVGPTNFQFSSTLAGVQSLDILVTDPAVTASCSRSSRTGSTCRFYISIVPTSFASGFRLSSNVDGGLEALIAGITLEDKGVALIPNTYTYTAASSSSYPVTISLTTYSGSPGLYVGCSLLGQTMPRGSTPSSYCKKEAPYLDGTSSAIATGSVVLDPAVDGLCACVGGKLYIGVNSFDAGTSLFGISVTDATMPATKLHDGVAVRGSIPGSNSGRLIYDFVFVPASIVSPTSSAVVVSLSQFTSNITGSSATIYAKFVSSATADSVSDIPSPTNFQFISRAALGIASITIPKMNANLSSMCGGMSSINPCRLRISLYADGGSTLLISARTDISLTLTDGVTIVGETTKGTMTYFRYTHMHPVSPLVIAVTPLTGPIAVYLGSTSRIGTIPPGPGNGMSIRSLVPVSSKFASTVLTFSINPNDADACVSPCSYVIGVTQQENADGIASFSVLARTRAVSTVPLLDGMATTDVISAGEYNYYSVTIPQTSTSMKISLTPQSGRARVFIAANGSVPGDPFSYFGDGFQFSSKMANFIGVEQELTISRGDPAIAKACSRVLPPAADGTIGLAYSPLPCTLSIAVFSDSGSTYTLVAYSKARLLPDGISLTVNQLMPGQWAYFVFEAASGASHVKLSLTPIVGTPEGFVSMTSTMPGPGDFLYSFGGLQGNTLTLDSATATSCDASQSRCIFFIAITPFSMSAFSSFKILGTSMKVQYINIDEPVSGHAGPSVGGFTYYGFILPETATQGVDVIVEPSTGGWLMAAIGADFNPATMVNFPPTATCSVSAPVGQAPYTVNTCPTSKISFVHSSFSSFGGPTRTRVSMKPDNPDYVPGKVYVLGVASSFESDFFLAIRPAGDAETLPNGILMHDSMMDKDTSYVYKVVVPTTGQMSQLAFQGIPTEGDIVLYLGVNNPNPSAASNDARATQANGYRFTINPDELANRCYNTAQLGQAPNPPGDGSTCAVYVRVVPAARSTFPTQYAIVALVDSDGSDPVRLTPGVPQLGGVLAGKYAYFFAPVSVPAGSTYYVSIVEENEGGVNAYINLQKDQSMKTWEFPSKTSFQMKSNAFVSPEIVSISPRGRSAAFYSNETTVLISIFGSGSVELDQFSQFYVTFGTSQDVVELPDGSAIEGSAEPSSSSYYSFSVGNFAADLSVAVTPLSGNPVVYASVWFTSDNAGVNKNLRPSKESSTWMSNFEGTLTIPKYPIDLNSCSGACTYIFSVFCESSIVCQFQISASSSGAVLTHLTMSVPAGGYLQKGQYKYYIFDAGHGNRTLQFIMQDYSGSSELYATDEFLPGISGAEALPIARPPCPAINGTVPDSCDQPQTYKFASSGGPPTFLKIVQEDLGDHSSTGLITTRSEHLYVIGVYALEGPLTYSLVGREKGTITVLSPGAISGSNVGTFGESDLFAFDNLDMFHDLVVTVSILYGDVDVFIATQGNIPSCTVSGREGAATSSCTNAVWKTSSSNTGVATLRINWKYPCGDQRITIDGACSSDDWQPGPILIAVVTTQSTLYTITADTGESPIRLLDGMPLNVLQGGDSQTQYMTFGALPDVAGSDVRFEFGARIESAPFYWYISSCIDFQCTVPDETPGPSPRKYKVMGGPVMPGDRVEIPISKRSPAYCSGNVGRGDTCEYFVSIAPDMNMCSDMNIAGCNAVVDVTAISLAGSAPLVVGFSQLNERMNSFVGLNRPDKYSYYRLFINEPTAPDDSLKDVVVRLDACDTLRGLAMGYICMSNAIALGNPKDRQQCENYKRPTSVQNNYVLSTLLNGYDRLINIDESANEMVVGISTRYIASIAASPEALAKYGPSNFELSVFDSEVVRMRMPWPEPPTTTFVQFTPNSGNLSWPAPVVTQYNAIGAPNVTAVGVTYNVYIAPVSFAYYASRVLNASVSDLGIVSTTACGIERWQRLVQDNITLISQTQRWILLENFSTALQYRVIVVAVCDEGCLYLNYDALGLKRPTGAGFSTQRLPYNQNGFILKAPAVITTAEPISSGFFGFVFFVVVVSFGGALFMAFGGKSTASTAETHGTLETSGGDGGVKLKAPDGRTIVVKMASHLFSARELRQERRDLPDASISKGKAVAGSTNNKDELEELARMSARVFKRTESQSVGGSSSSSSVKQVVSVASPLAVVVAVDETASTAAGVSSPTSPDPWAAKGVGEKEKDPFDE